MKLSSKWKRVQREYVTFRWTIPLKHCFLRVFVCRFDSGKDGFIDLMELKLMMEKLGAPQTHLGLKNMIKEVDEDYDGKLSYREVCVYMRVSFSWYSYSFVKSVIISDDWFNSDSIFWEITLHRNTLDSDDPIRAQ